LLIRRNTGLAVGEGSSVTSAQQDPAAAAAASVSPPGSGTVSD